ncbi:MAG: hypothetical protein N3G75_01555 [Methanothrix sp.]|nr:hypothetical protein [Methanothrix sp.]MCX8206505.1 hypothetical protein [Methanothrix sp.]
MRVLRALRIALLTHRWWALERCKIGISLNTTIAYCTTGGIDKDKQDKDGNIELQYDPDLTCYSKIV